MLLKNQLSRVDTEMFFVTLTLKVEVKVTRDVQKRGWSTVEKQASRIINIPLYCEHTSLTALNQNLFACIHLTCPLSRSVLHGTGFGV